MTLPGLRGFVIASRRINLRIIIYLRWQSNRDKIPVKHSIKVCFAGTCTLAAFFMGSQRQAQ
jgi:hypothetical protein